MKALLIEINGQAHCLAGVENGYVYAMLGICTREAGGLTVYGKDEETAVNSVWPGRELSDGDTVTIRIVETDVVSPPEISGILRPSNT